MIEINLSHIHIHIDPVVRKSTIYIFTEKDPHVYFTVQPSVELLLGKIRTDAHTEPIIIPYKPTTIWVTEEITSYM